MKKLNVLIFAEDITQLEHCKAAYPNGLHEAIGGSLEAGCVNIRTAVTENVAEVITAEVLAETDVVIWWGHNQHHLISDEVAALVMTEVQKGMGLIVLHSGHIAKPFVWLLGTTGHLGWRQNCRERVWTVSPYHPIAAGVPAHFELPEEEMYSEPFDIPSPEDTVFIGWFAGGEVFRSGVTFKRGYGKIFYFQPGHETYPIYYNDIIRLIIKNAVNWAAPNVRREFFGCPNMKALEG